MGHNCSFFSVSLVYSTSVPRGPSSVNCCCCCCCCCYCYCSDGDVGYHVYSLLKSDLMVVLGKVRVCCGSTRRFWAKMCLGKSAVETVPFVAQVQCIE